MASTAAGEAIPVEETGGSSRKLKEVMTSAPMISAVVAGIFALSVAVGGPRVTRSWQDHSKRVEVATQLATDMSRSSALAIGASQRVATVLIYGQTDDASKNRAAIQQEYNLGLGRWQVDSGRVAAKLTVHFRHDPIVAKWKLYRLNVSRFYRLSAVLPPGNLRPSLITNVKKYLQDVKTTDPLAPSIPTTEKAWDPIQKALRQNKHFSRSLTFRNAYNTVASMLLALGDVYVEEMIGLRADV
jgi:hypothetical protein